MYTKLFLTITPMLLVLIGAVVIITQPNDVLFRVEDDVPPVNLTNTSCIYSERIVGRLYFHECVKEQKTVYDLRYFWKTDNGVLKASIIGVQMMPEVFFKVCNRCSIVNKSK